MQQDSTNSDSVMDLDAGPSPDMDVDAVAAEAAFESQPDPAAASLVWHTRPDGTVELQAPAAVMDDADDAEEDDVDMLQVCWCVSAGSRVHVTPQFGVSTEPPQPALTCKRSVHAACSVRLLCCLLRLLQVDEQEVDDDVTAVVRRKCQQNAAQALFLALAPSSRVQL